LTPSGGGRAEPTQDRCPRPVRSRPGALLTLFLVLARAAVGGHENATLATRQCSASRDRSQFHALCRHAGNRPCARFVSLFFRSPAQKGSPAISFGAPHEQNVMSRIVNIGPGTGGVAVEPVAMQVIVPLERAMQLPLNLAGSLRSTFAEVASSPLPERLAALVRRLNAKRTASSGEGLNDGPSTTKSSRLDRRGRC
jgi:hypothetical protein